MYKLGWISIVCAAILSAPGWAQTGDSEAVKSKSEMSKLDKAGAAQSAFEDWLSSAEGKAGLTAAAKAVLAEKATADIETEKSTNPGKKPLSEPIDPVDFDALDAESTTINKIKSDPAYRLVLFERARAAHHDGDGAGAIHIFTALATHARHTPSMRWLARMAFKGEGQEENKTLGFDWYHKAALAGDIVAMMQTGGLALEGEGTQQSDVTARHWFLYAADRGAKDVDGELLKMFDKGIGGAPDKNITLVFAKRRAKAFEPDGLYYMGRAYRDGDGVDQDLQEARRMLAAAAEYGHTKAAAALTDMTSGTEGGGKE